jgi:predicted ATPase
MAVRVSSPVLVGRSGQLAALDAALAAARDGNPSAVLVGGEAGVGKSRLVTEFAEHARGAGVRVLTGGCLELGTDGLPFAHDIHHRPSGGEDAELRACAEEAVTVARQAGDAANELFISVKTASVHVSNILGKLGVASRGEAAATAHRLQLLES